MMHNDGAFEQNVLLVVNVVFRLTRDETLSSDVQIIVSVSCVPVAQRCFQKSL